MLIAPVWGERTAFFTVLMVYIVIINILNEIEVNKIIQVFFNKYFKFILLAGALAYLFVYFNTFLAFKDRERLISTQKENNAEIIEVIELPNYTLWTPNPNDNDDDLYHTETFKKYYGIQGNKIELIKGNFKYMILYRSE